ncbi:MAG: hypothetical protein R3E08_11350 [Thiotrichaceae bacterium]
MTYNTLLRQAQRPPSVKHSHYSRAMQAADSSHKVSSTKKQKMRHYTVDAVRPSVRKNRQNHQVFEEWAKTKGSQHPAWQEFYKKLSEP